MPARLLALLLFVEVLKSTRTGGDSVVDHALSMMVFVACLILFLVWPLAGTSLFFLIMLTTLVDVIAGFSVTIRSARRDYRSAAKTRLASGELVEPILHRGELRLQVGDLVIAARRLGRWAPSSLPPERGRSCFRSAPCR